MLTIEEKQRLKEIGKQLRKLRLNNKLTQAQVAFELNTSTKHYQRIEYGEINSRILTFYKLADIFETDILEIIT